MFSEGWNCHQVRTANHLSPQQLFLRGCLQLQNSGLAALDFFEVVDSLYGVDAEEIPMDVEVSNPDKCCDSFS